LEKIIKFLLLIFRICAIFTRPLPGGETLPSGIRWGITQTKTNKTKQTMKTITNSTCDLELNVEVPSTIAEAVSLFGEDAVLMAAIRQTFYGPWNSTFRREFAKKLEEVTGVKRPQLVQGGVPVTRSTKTGEVPVLVTENTYFKKLLSENAISIEDYAKTGQQVADTIKLEIPAAEREAAPSKEFVALAKQIFAKIEAGAIGTDGQVITEDSVTGKLEATNPGLSLESVGGFTIEGLARALQIDDKRRRLEAQQSFL
jgi:hypothetical protein